MPTSQELSPERRKHARSVIDRTATFEHEHGVANGVLMDISFFGALFEMNDDHAIGARLGLLVVPFSRDPAEAVQVHAKVVYRRDRSVGLTWDALAPEDIIKVRRLAQGDPSRPWMLMRPAHSLFFLRRAV